MPQKSKTNVEMPCSANGRFTTPQDLRDSSSAETESTSEFSPCRNLPRIEKPLIEASCLRRIGAWLLRLVYWPRNCLNGVPPANFIQGDQPKLLAQKAPRSVRPCSHRVRVGELRDIVRIEKADRGFRAFRMIRQIIVMQRLTLRLHRSQTG